MKRLLGGAIALGAVVLIVSVLYLTGPQTRCAYDTTPGPTDGGYGGSLLCLKHERTNAWERISGAITGN